MSGYMIMATALTSAGLLLSYGSASYRYLGYTLAGFSPPILYLIWMFRSDRFEREPLTLVALTFGWGSFCALFAAVFNILLAVPLLGAPGAAFVEEPLKLLGVYLLARHESMGSEFNDHLDGMIYGAAAGAGFAGLENLSYLLTMIMEGGVPPFLAILIRSTASFNHIAWTAIAGRSLGLAKALRGYSRVEDLIPGLVVVVPLHFAWNLMPFGLVYFGLLLFTLTVLFRQVRTAIEDEERWGFSSLAPVE